MAKVNDDFPELAHWVAASDAALELGLSRQTINRKILNREFKTTHRLGSQYAIKRSEINQWKKVLGIPVEGETVDEQ